VYGLTGSDAEDGAARTPQYQSSRDAIFNFHLCTTEKDVPGWGGGNQFAGPTGDSPASAGRSAGGIGRDVAVDDPAEDLVV
jgi:hypothetical protein